MQRLPEDIVVDILSRVPVKTLVKIRYVCKSWYAIISNKKFSKLQLEQSNKNKNADNLKLLIISYFSKQLSLVDYEHDDYCVSKVDYPHVEANKYYSFSLGSCNGLFCLQIEREIVVWNPSIRQYKIVPKPCDSLSFPGVYGFGYDSLSDDYKAVRLRKAPGKIIVDIYNLKTNSWRSIDFPTHKTHNYKFLSGRPNNYLNCSVHWLATMKFDTTERKLVAFSLVDEKFLEVPMPDVVDDINSKFRSMCVFEGCLCLFRMDRVDSGGGVELWVMKEYMIKASWTKLCTVLWESMPTNNLMYADFSPLCSLRHGDILLGLIMGVGMVEYNIKERRFTSIVELKLSDCPEAIEHVESLVSPNFSILIDLSNNAQRLKRRRRRRRI